MRLNKIILCGAVILLTGSVCFGAGKKPDSGEEEKAAVEQTGPTLDNNKSRPEEVVEKRQEPQIVKDKNEIRFVDDKGEILKQLAPGIKEQMKEKNGKEYKIANVKRAVVSKNNKYVAVSEYDRETAVITETGKTKKLGELGKRNSKLMLYNSAGQLLFEIIYPEGKSTGGTRGIIVSDTGVTAVRVSEKFKKAIIYVYSKEGDEILSYTGFHEASYPEILQISSNGRYLAIRDGYPITAIFFDTKNGTSWKADKDYGIAELNNDGTTRVTPGPGKVYTIDLKEHLGN